MVNIQLIYFFVKYKFEISWVTELFYNEKGHWLNLKQPAVVNLQKHGVCFFFVFDQSPPLCWYEAVKLRIADPKASEYQT